MSKKYLSRRTFLRGSGGILVGIPFLEAMVPSLAWAQSALPKRMLVMYGGAPSFFHRDILPTGALGPNLIPAIQALAPVRQHVSVLMNLEMPIYQKDATPPPAGCVNQQHAAAPAPFLAGKPSYNKKGMLHECHTIDQKYADIVSGTTPITSLQVCSQAAPYNGKIASVYKGGQISSRYENGVLNVQTPIVDPTELYNKLFSIPTGGSSTGLDPRKSVLDLVLDDANRLSSKLGSTDKAKLDQHFEYIREIEKGLASTSSGGSTCTKPSPPPQVSGPSTYNFGGWADETLRRDLFADMLAVAISCDLTRSLSWSVTHDQCWLGSKNISGIDQDIHYVSHHTSEAGYVDAMKMQYNWHCEAVAKVVAKLASFNEGAGSVLDNTFIGFGTGEGISAHNRKTMHMIVAGCKDKIKLGQAINASGVHPGKMWISGLQALGTNENRLGDLTGPISALMK